MNTTSLSSLKAAIIATVSQLAAFAVAFGLIQSTEIGIIVSAATALVNTGFLVANAIHDLAASKVKVAQIAAGRSPQNVVK